jgi:hypothetical protein
MYGVNGTRKETIVGHTIRGIIASFAIVAMLVSTGLMPASAAEQVKFKGHFSGSLAFDGVSFIQLTGAGNASKLGRSTNSSAVSIVGPAASCPGGFAIHGEETVTGANGDQITWTIDDDACPTDTPNVYRISATYTVTGGTGRFAGATGQGTIECLGDFANGTFDFTVTGTISRPHH